VAKELPYFKFDVSEWISGAITLEDFYTQGVFINICAHYWFKSGCLTLTEIKRRVKCKETTITALIDNKLIKVTDDTISISFLDEQLNERNAKREINKLNGSKGGAPIGNKNAIKDKQETTEKQHKTTNIEESREEENRREKKEEVPLRAFVDEKVNEAWVEWVQYLKEKKKKITPSTAKKQISFLGARAGPEAIEIINKSITNGWAGLFELTNNKNVNGQHNKTTSGDFVPKQFSGANYKTKL